MSQILRFFGFFFEVPPVNWKITKKPNHPGISTFLRFSPKIRLFTSFLGKLQQKFGRKKNCKNDFSEKVHKIPMRKPPTKISGDPEFFYRNFVKTFSRSGGPYRRFGAFISKVETRNFCQLGKNVFFVLPFFLNRQQKH